MDGPALISSLRPAVPGATLESAASVDLQTTLYVSREHVLDVARALRDLPELRFAFLAELTAVDVWPRLQPRERGVYVPPPHLHRDAALSAGFTANRPNAARGETVG